MPDQTLIDALVAAGIRANGRRLLSPARATTLLLLARAGNPRAKGSVERAHVGIEKVLAAKLITHSNPTTRP